MPKEVNYSEKIISLKAAIAALRSPENGVIPRTPKVILENDDTWHPISEIENYLLEFVRNHRSRMGRR